MLKNVKENNTILMFYKIWYFFKFGILLSKFGIFLFLVFSGSADSDSLFNVFQVKLLKQGTTVFKFSVTVDLCRQMPGNIEVIEPLHPKTQQ